MPGALLLLWLCLPKGQVPLLPTPEEVGSAWLDLLHSGALLENTSASLRRLIWGLSLGFGAGCAIGSASALHARVRRLSQPLLSFVTPVPPIAWIPFLLLFLGLGENLKIGFVALGTFLIVQFQAFNALSQSDVSLLELATALRKSRGEMLLWVLWPSALPALFAALRQSLALGWTLLLTAEIVASSQGLGWLVWDSRNFGRTDDTLAAVFTIALLGYAGDRIVQIIEHRCTLWRATSAAHPKNVHV